MARQMTIEQAAQPMRQPPFRSAIVIHMRKLAGVMRVPLERTAQHDELVRTFGELSWNDEHLYEIVSLLHRQNFQQTLTRELIRQASMATLPKGANRSLGCSSCQETGWRQVTYANGYSGVVKCHCSAVSEQAELALA